MIRPLNLSFFDDRPQKKRRRFAFKVVEYPFKSVVLLTEGPTTALSTLNLWSYLGSRGGERLPPSKVTSGPRVSPVE